MNIIDSIKDIVEDFDLKFYGTESAVENDRKIFRIFVTSKDGVSLESCAKISNIISPLLDLNPPMSGNYFLEVSSPGILRKLKSIENFEYSVGNLVKITLFSTEKLKGEIVKVEEQKITIKEEDNEISTINFSDIDKAKTYYNW